VLFHPLHTFQSSAGSIRQTIHCRRPGLPVYLEQSEGQCDFSAVLSTFRQRQKTSQFTISFSDIILDYMIDDIVSWYKTGLQQLTSLAQDRRKWKLITRQVMDTNGRWSSCSSRRRRYDRPVLNDSRSRSDIHRVSKKVAHCTLVHIFAKY